MIQKHGKCIGLKLLKFGRYQWELWFCPAGEVIKEHVHRYCDISMMILGGRMQGRIGKHSGPVGWNDMFRVFPIPAGVVHNAVVLNPGCVFLSIEKWRSDNVTSASEDFVLTAESFINTSNRECDSSNFKVRIGVKRT